MVKGLFLRVLVLFLVVILIIGFSCMLVFIKELNHNVTMLVQCTYNRI
jgi:hypothetical protein